ncbi:MAG: tyrosine-type recombinase/integrase [Anaerolineae bacterium]|nr:tyrosine-type recombinase/integrase [Anaerolineae bacterium]
MNHLMTYSPSLSPDLVIPHSGEMRTVIDWNHWRKRRAFLLAQDSEIPHYLVLPEVHLVLERAKDLETHFLTNTLWHTGARISEALALTKESFHLDGVRNSMVALATAKQRERGRPSSKAKAKAKPKRYVPVVNPAYLDEVERYLATRKPNKEEPVFTMSRQAFDNRLKAIQDELQLPVASLSAHTFRHSFAVSALFQGRTLKTVQDWLGHRNIADTEIYARVLSGETHHLMYGMIF